MTSPAQAPNAMPPARLNASVAPIDENWARPGEACVVSDLKRFGPGQNEAVSIEFANDYCRQLCRNHYENFSVASILVPRRFRQDIANVYAYCRWVDDLADELSSTEESLKLLDWWEQSLAGCFRGDAVHPVFVALEKTIETHQLPRAPFEGLIRAFRQDQWKDRYATDEELRDYCSGSANPVGRILLCLSGTTSDQAFSWSDSICTGLQIVNFCQDVRRDAQRNRIYFPSEHWKRFGLTEDVWLSGTNLPALQASLEYWCEHAKQNLLSGLPLVRAVPKWLARDVQLFVRGGLSLLDEIQHKKYDVWNHSIHVSKATKLRLMLRAWLAPYSLSH